MKIVALEEHLVTPAMLDAWLHGPQEAEDHAAAGSSREPLRTRLFELGAARIAAMDDQGVDMQVLSVTQPGVQNLHADQAIVLAREANNAIAAAVAAHPNRFDGFATLPTPAPDEASRELHRAVEDLGLKGAMVFGRTGGRNADDPLHEPVWRAASALRAPIYLHPQRPQRQVVDAYYGGFSEQTNAILASGLIGWHYETGIQLLRMMLGGVFDRNPNLQVIVGHWGETVLFWESRFALLQKRGHIPGKQLVEYFREHVHVTGSGDTSARPLAWTKEVIGADRMLFATDYPFIDNGNGIARSFLTNADLSEVEREAIAHGNWERLTAHLR